MGGENEWLNKVLILTLMESKNVTLRMITKRAGDLRQERILTYHLTHPELTEAHLHPSRRMS